MGTPVSEVFFGVSWNRFIIVNNLSLSLSVSLSLSLSVCLSVSVFVLPCLLPAVLFQPKSDLSFSLPPSILQFHPLTFWLSLLCLPQSQQSQYPSLCLQLFVSEKNEWNSHTHKYFYFFTLFLSLFLPFFLQTACFWHTPHPPHHYHICQMKCFFWLDHSPRPLSNHRGKLE